MNEQMNISSMNGGEYFEEGLKPVVTILILIVLIILLPFSWFIKTTHDAGLSSSDMSSYTLLAEEVKGDILLIRNNLASSTVDNVLLNGVSSAPTVGLIASETILTNAEPELPEDPKKLDVQLKAIYWNPAAPLVTIGDENYRIGERVNGFTIVDIRKTSVVFESPLGETIVKNFYESLNDTLR